MTKILGVRKILTLKEETVYFAIVIATRHQFFYLAQQFTSSGVLDKYINFNSCRRDRFKTIIKGKRPFLTLLINHFEYTDVTEYSEEEIKTMAVAEIIARRFRNA